MIRVKELKKVKIEANVRAKLLGKPFVGKIIGPAYGDCFPILTKSGPNTIDRNDYKYYGIDNKFVGEQFIWIDRKNLSLIDCVSCYSARARYTAVDKQASDNMCWSCTNGS